MCTMLRGDRFGNEMTMIEPGLLHLNINHLHNGMYVVRVQTDLGTQFAEPLLVQRR